MAREMLDIGLDDAGDLEITDGDFGSEESTGQHQRQLLLNNKGAFKQSPEVCVGTTDFIDDEGKGNVMREISKQFLKDGMEVINLNPNKDSIADSKVRVFENAYYK